MLQKDCFVDIGKSEHISTYFKHINLDLPEWQSYMGWEASIIPLEAVLIEDKLAEIHAKFPIEGAAVLKMEPNECYKWHIDSDRGCSINMLLEDTNSICLFGQDKNENNLDIIELKYRPDTFYLFNTRIPHTVINFSGMRYMFSIQFQEYVEYETAYRELAEDFVFQPNEFSRLL